MPVSINENKKLLAPLIHSIRRMLWSILGLPWDTLHGLARRKYLFDAEEVSIGHRTYDNGALIWRWSSKETVQIGKFCSIAFGVQFLCGAGHHDVTAVTTYPLYKHLFADEERVEINGELKLRKIWDEKLAFSNGPIVIGNDVWIQQNAIILSGVKIGSGAVVLAGSIVTKDVEPYVVVGGVPAKTIKRRFDEVTSRKLLEIGWWDWTDSLIKERISDFYNLEVFLHKYYGQ